MIAAPVQCDVDGVPKGSHFVRVAPMENTASRSRTATTRLVRGRIGASLQLRHHGEARFSSGLSGQLVVEQRRRGQHRPPAVTLSVGSPAEPRRTQPRVRPSAGLTVRQRSGWLTSQPRAGGADVVLNGHNHNYSRWLPTDPSGTYDPAHGLTQFIVGTGGRNLNGFGGQNAKPITFVRGQSSEFGVLELTLHPGSYDFLFRSTLGSASGFIDAGSSVPCH